MLDLISTSLISYVIETDKDGREIILCKHGSVYAAEDKNGEHIVAILKNGTPHRRCRLFKLRLLQLWTNDDECAVRFGPDKLYKVLKILKPLRPVRSQAGAGE